MKNSKIKFIVDYSVSTQSYEVNEGLIHLVENKRTIFTAKIPETIKNIILSGISKSEEFKKELHKELENVRKNTFDNVSYKATPLPQVALS